MKDLFKPITSAKKYQSGQLSTSAIRFRQIIFFISAILFVIGLYFLPTYTFLTDVTLPLLFVVAYVGIPFFISRNREKKNHGDFLTLFAVVHTPVSFLSLLLFLVLTIIGIFLISQGIIIEMLPVIIEQIINIFAIILISMTFKKIRNKSFRQFFIRYG